MTTKTIVHTIGTPCPSTITLNPRGEAWNLSLAVKTSAGAAANLTGYQLLLYCQDVDGAAQAPVAVNGDSTGLATWHKHGSETILWGDRRQYEVELIQLANPDDPAQIVAPSYITVTSSLMVAVPWTYYYGVGVAGRTDAVGLTSATRFGGLDFTFTVSPDDQKVYLVYPKSLGTATVTVDGLPVDIMPLRTITVSTVPCWLTETTNLLTEDDLEVVVGP
jgi:hypothetical protein